MGNCCFKGAEEPQPSGPSQSNAASPSAGGGGGGAAPPGVPALPKSKRGLNAAQTAALNALHQAGVIESEDDVFKTDFSDGSMPPLHSQARKGNHTHVEQLLLLDKEKTSTRLVYGSRTPLHQAAAAKQGRLKTCKMLLDFDDWQLEQKTTDGRTPYHMASESDDDGGGLVALFLAKSGPEMLAEKRTNGSTCLHNASSAGRTEMVRAVAKVDPALINVVDGEVRTCLHLAAMGGHTGVAEVLCNVEGVQLANKDRSGYTALAHAAMSGHDEIVKLLISKDKTLVSVRDRAGKSPFDLAAEFGKSPQHWKAAQYILAAEPTLITGKVPEAPKKEEDPAAADAKPKSKLGGAFGKMGLGAAGKAAAPAGPTQSALHYAAAFGQKEGAKMLLAQDPKMIKEKNKDGNTPLHMAASGGHAELLLSLIADNGGVGDPNNDGNNVLHLACAGGHLEAAQALLKEHPALIKEKNAKGQTCLFSASLSAKPPPNPKVAKAILSAAPELLTGADGEGKTVLHHVAKLGNCDDLVWLYGEKGGKALVHTKDGAGSDCLADAAPACSAILEELMEREADDAESKARNV